MTDGMFWMTAKHDGDCTECEGPIEKGDRIVWAPETYKAYCKFCGIELIGEEDEA